MSTSKVLNRSPNADQFGSLLATGRNSTARSIRRHRIHIHLIPGSRVHTSGRRLLRWLVLLLCRLLLASPTWRIATFQLSAGTTTCSERPRDVAFTHDCHSDRAGEGGAIPSVARIGARPTSQPGQDHDGTASHRVCRSATAVGQALIDDENLALNWPLLLAAF